MADPKQILLHNRSRPGTRPVTADWCASFLCRLRGLTFRKSLPPDRGLLLVQQRESRMDAAIHMLWMRMDLAVVWLDAGRQVVDARPAYRWRSMLTPSAPAKYVLEMSIEYLDRFKVGDEVEFEEIPAD